MSDPITYNIKTVEDFLNVPEDRIDRCLEEFKCYLELVPKMIDMMEALSDEGKEKVKHNMIFAWTDDNINKSTITVEVNDEHN